MVRSAVFGAWETLFGHWLKAPSSLGFNQIAEEVGNIENVYTIENYTDEQFSSILDTLDVTKTDYVFSFNDILARSAWQVAENKGLADELKFVGVDG